MRRRGPIFEIATKGRRVALDLAEDVEADRLSRRATSQTPCPWTSRKAISSCSVKDKF